MTASGHWHSMPRGTRLASAGWDKTIKIWDVGNNKELFMIKAHNDTVTALAFSPDGQLLASASLDGKVKIWNANCAASGPLKKDSGTACGYP